MNYWYSCYLQQPIDKTPERMREYIERYTRCSGPFTHYDAARHKSLFLDNSKYYAVQIPVMQYLPGNLMIARLKAIHEIFKLNHDSQH
jgi:hypothetical protein